jgi:hypothetical protein
MFELKINPNAAFLAQLSKFDVKLRDERAALMKIALEEGKVTAKRATGPKLPPHLRNAGVKPPSDASTAFSKPSESSEECEECETVKAEIYCGKCSVTYCSVCCQKTHQYVPVILYLDIFEV